MCVYCIMICQPYVSTQFSPWNPAVHLGRPHGAGDNQHYSRFTMYQMDKKLTCRYSQAFGHLMVANARKCPYQHAPILFLFFCRDQPIEFIRHNRGFLNNRKETNSRNFTCRLMGTPLSSHRPNSRGRPQVPLKLGNALLLIPRHPRLYTAHNVFVEGCCRVPLSRR